MVTKISGAMQKALDEFDGAAKCGGWQEDQGVGEAVDNAEAEYNRTKSKLTKLILQQQQRLRVAQGQYTKIAGK